MTFTESDLQQFTGCMQPFKDGMFPGIIYTDGVKFLRDNGCNWLVVDILSNAIHYQILKEQTFLTVKVNKEAQSITFIGLNDEGEEVDLLIVDEYICFDVPCDLTLFVAMVDINLKMLMLASEY